MEKKLDGNNRRMLQAILNKSWRQHFTIQQLYGHQTPITKTILVRQTRHAGHCWRNNYEFISHILLWTASHGREKAGQPARTYLKQLCANTGCSLEGLLGAMDDRDRWWKRVREVCAGCAASWWWWWWYFPKHWLSSLLGLYNTLTASLMRVKTSPKQCPDIWY